MFESESTLAIESVEIINDDGIAKPAVGTSNCVSLYSWGGWSHICCIFSHEPIGYNTNINIDRVEWSRLLKISMGSMEKCLDY